MMSTDLRNPLPNTTYFVDDYAYFATDDLGRATHIHIEDVELRDGTQRSRAAQRNVAGGVEGYDAGHGLARLFGGAREEINLTRMISELNQGQTGNPRTVRAIENTLEAALKDTAGRSGITFDLKIAYPKGSASPSGSTWSVPPRSYDFTIVQGDLPIKHRMADGQHIDLLDFRVRNQAVRQP